MHKNKNCYKSTLTLDGSSVKIAKNFAVICNFTSYTLILTIRRNGTMQNRDKIPRAGPTSALE